MRGRYVRVGQEDAPQDHGLELLEENARKARLGLWMTPNPIPPCSLGPSDGTLLEIRQVPRTVAGSAKIPQDWPSSPATLFLIISKIWIVWPCDCPC